jgi:competence protein ComEC
MILIPVGYKNRFGFPHQTVLQRYEAQHINWLSSAGQGAITVHLAKTGNTVESYRNKHGRYWHMKPGQ